MEKILLVLTGGTICSFADIGGVKNSDCKRAFPLLIENLKNTGYDCSEFEFDIISPFDILSENMDINSWNGILKLLSDVDFSEYKGIIAAHGTDTLAYTASMLSIMLAGKGIIPLILVSSQYPLYDCRANGNENFKCAVELIMKGISPNVYAVYRNSDGIVYIHKGAELLQCRNCCEDFFSRNMLPADNWQDIRNKCFENEMIIYKGLLAENTVLVIEPYPGIDYSSFSLEGKKCVLHYLYHSSTAAVKCGNNINSAIYLAEKCRQKGIPFVITPFNSKLLNGGEIYSSTKALLEAGADVLCDVSRETAYSKAVIASSFYEGEEIVKFLKKEINDEFAYKW